MDLLQVCVNCGIGIRERIRRHLISSLRPDITVLLSEWLTFELSPHSCVCGDCYAMMTRCLAINSRERQFGHNYVCYGCGRSVARARRYNIPQYSPLASVVSFWHHHVTVPNFLCNRCFIRANRELTRRAIVDAVRFDNIEGNQQEMPIPPPLPPDPVIRNIQDSSTITLPNYRRCANTSRRCIFDGCQHIAGHLVPTLTKSALLLNNKLYIPRSARVCEEHLNSNEWELLLENTSLTNTFTANQIEILLDNKIEENVIDFENMESMPSHMCHYWTGRSIQEFIELHNNIPLQSVVPKKSKTALAMLLFKYRTGDSDARISSLFRVPKSTLQYKMNHVRKYLTEHFVPQHLGVAHITHQQISERNTMIPEKLFGNPQSVSSDRWAIVTLNTEHSVMVLTSMCKKDYKYQKKTYGLPKYQNLMKPFLVVDVFGPYSATQTDAEIMNYLVSREGGLFELFHRNDVFILDRGFRDSISNLESLGYQVHKPETRNEGETQLTALQANKSRCVTLCRWVVEIVNGRFKRDYKLFRNVFSNLASSHLMEDFRITAAIMNKFHNVIQNPDNAGEITEIYLLLNI